MKQDGSPYSIALIPGDGIGPEVVGCGRRVLEALAQRGGPRFEFAEWPAGHGCWARTGDPLPDDTIEAAKKADGVLAGAMDVAALPPEAPSPLGGMRNRLDTYANIRPAHSFKGIVGPLGEVDMVVVRENTEGIYSGIEYDVGPDGACGVRVITRRASQRIARVAFEQARKRRKLVTAVHKLGALKRTDRLFLESVRQVAVDYPDVTLETKNIDACAMEMIQHPRHFDVICATNTFGDILSDIAAALAGGIGLSSSACVGDEYAYFEPVHGTAPDIAGKGIANPIATILTAALMLRHLGEDASADRIVQGVERVLEEGKVRTGDLGGKATSVEMTDAIIGAL